MRKIPTLFRRDSDDLRRVTRDVHPDCEWVLDGAGRPTRKYDGTCVRLDDDGVTWWARREVKPGRTPPPGFLPVEHDRATGKVVGWEPMAQSAFAKYHRQALDGTPPVLDGPGGTPTPGATYELVGPKVNGNPEQADRHLLVRHGHQSAEDDAELAGLPRDHDGLRDWLLAHPAWEGIVWHHPDGRRAKLKRRDFPTG
ncbi:hypothetical protein [Micromonospora sp. DT233]|uniref:hypothetical protein n=1 Tax=Micromonospora sp. DT233 TaxID=3393432 RepID=UPI003CEB7915